MCGILAVLCSYYPKQLAKILFCAKYLSKRGPDNCISIVKPGGIYIFHRLCINDTSIDGNQPMVDRDVFREILMMCNGEIYNHEELRREYKLECNSKSDCEVILQLYKKIGFVETVKKLYGVFAIVLVDGNNVYLARDRIGVRPLYFGLTEENFLAVSSVPNSIVPFCHHVAPFPPGVIAVHTKSSQDRPENMAIMSYLYKEKICRLPEVQCNLRDTLFNAVRYRLISDRPIGCLLSGGLDSSIIAYILTELLGAKNVRTYSIGMEGSTDLYYARKIADFLGTVHHEVLFTPQEGFAIIPSVIEALASYDITTIRASVGMYLLCAYISKTTSDKVIFSGEGSDEIFGGYLYFHNAPSPQEAENESLRLVQELHLYDVLRADRCISVHGLEARVPFLDRKVVDYALSLSGVEKMPKEGYEKYILRKAFEGCLPAEIIWRRKEGFSDGVSSVKKSWYQYIQENVDTRMGDELYNPSLFPSKEAMYYRLVFNSLFPTYNLSIPYWMPKWSDSSDPSGRLLKAYDEDSESIGAEDEFLAEKI